MPSPALAMAWHLWRPHRWGLTAFLVYLLLLVAAAHLFPGLDFSTIALRNGILLASAPLVSGLLYLMAVFAHPEADVAAAGSGYPPHLLLLPVRTRELVLWPMLLGVISVSLGWLALSRLVMIPMGIAAPAGWPAAMVAALLACLQAVFWAPLGVPYLRIALALTVIPGLLALGFWGGGLQRMSPPALIGVYLGLIPFAYLAAVTGLARARRGDAPDWRWLAWPTRTTAGAATRRPRPFASPAAAQRWFEWRRSGLLLPLFVGVACLFFSLPLLWLPERAPLAELLLPPFLFAPGVGEIQANVCLRGQQYALIVPPLLAMLVGCGLRKHDQRKKELAVPPFLAVRPVGSAGLVLAQLQVAAWSTLAAWGVMLMFALAWLLLPARDGATTAPLVWLLLPHVTPRVGMAACLALAGMIAWTWKNQVQTLFVDLAGRLAAICGYPVALAGLMAALFLLAGTSPDRAAIFAPLLLLSLLVALVSLRAWIVYGYPVGAIGLTLAMVIFLYLAHHPLDEIARLREPLVLLAEIAAGIKLLLAACTLAALRRRRLIAARGLAGILAAWLLLCAALFLLLLNLLPAGFVPTWALIVSALLLAPLTQLALAPLALASSRHQ